METFTNSVMVSDKQASLIENFPSPLSLDILLSEPSTYEWSKPSTTCPLFDTSMMLVVDELGRVVHLLLQRMTGLEW